MTTTSGVENPGLVVGHAHKCGGIEPVNGIESPMAIQM